jgi:hypothetical protein
MNVVDHAWKLDRLIAEVEKTTFLMTLRVLELIKNEYDATGEQIRLIDLTEQLMILRFQRAALPGATQAPHQMESA